MARHHRTFGNLPSMMFKNLQNFKTDILTILAFVNSKLVDATSTNAIGLIRLKLLPNITRNTIKFIKRKKNIKI